VHGTPTVSAVQRQQAWIQVSAQYVGNRNDEHVVSFGRGPWLWRCCNALNLHFCSVDQRAQSVQELNLSISHRCNPDDLSASRAQGHVERARRQQQYREAMTNAPDDGKLVDHPFMARQSGARDLRWYDSPRNSTRHDLMHRDRKAPITSEECLVLPGRTSVGSVSSELSQESFRTKRVRCAAMRKTCAHEISAWERVIDSRLAQGPGMIRGHQCGKAGAFYAYIGNGFPGNR